MTPRILFVGTSHTRGFQKAFSELSDFEYVDFFVLSGPLWRLCINQSSIEVSDGVIKFSFYDKRSLASSLDNLDSSWDKMKSNLSRVIGDPVIARRIKSYSHVVFVDFLFRFDRDLSLNSDGLLAYQNSVYSTSLLSLLPQLCGHYFDYPFPISSSSMKFSEDNSCSFAAVIRLVCEACGSDSKKFLWRYPGFRGGEIDFNAHDCLHRRFFNCDIFDIELLTPPSSLLDESTGRILPSFEQASEHADQDFYRLCLKDLLSFF